jgi:hypothetical protein
MRTTAIARPTGAPANETALTAATGSVEIQRAALVYRRFGNAGSDAPPLLFLQHFRGNLDNWDRALVDRVAGGREVILLCDRGVGASNRDVPDDVEDVARDILSFVDAIGLGRSHVLGLSPTRTTPTASWGCTSRARGTVARRSSPGWPRSPSRRWSSTATTTR